MLILGLESSAKAASAALCRDGELLGQYTQCSGLTHSRTLLPMVEDLLKNTETKLADVDAVAVARGPGSFTGIRIGVAAVKGLCWGAQKPAIGVSTLAAMAWNGVAAGEGSIICCCMDARRQQVYNALFEIRDGRPVKLSQEATAIAKELAPELEKYEKRVFLVGDGARLCYNLLGGLGVESTLAPEPLVQQSAYGVCRAAETEKAAPASELLPVYLRLSQAERERQARLANS